MTALLHRIELSLRLSRVILVTFFSAFLVLTMSVTARADSGTSNVDPSRIQNLISVAQLGPKAALAAHSQSRVATVTPKIVAPNTTRGLYTTAIAYTVGGITYLKGNAHSMKRGNYELVGTIYVNGVWTGGVGPVLIRNNTSGSLPDLLKCYIPGSTIRYDVGLLNSAGTDVIDLDSATTKA
jgi:hypothetical protein